MKAAIVLLGALLIHTPLMALTRSKDVKAVFVDWSCPESGGKTLVSVFYDDTGKLTFSPDIFSDLKKEEGVDYSKCIADFQKRIDSGVQEYQKERCPQENSSLCAATPKYTNLRVIQNIQKSYFMKKYQDVRIVPLTVTTTTSNTTTTITTRIKDTETIDKPDTKPETKPETKPDPAPTTPEAFLEEKIAKKEIDPKQLNKTFEFDNKTFKVSDFDKVIGRNLDSIYSGLTLDEGKQFAQNYMLAKSDYLEEGDDSPKKKAVMDNLNRMFTRMYGDRGAEELAKMLDCAPPDAISPIENILSVFTRTQKVNKCKPLAGGEHKVFKKDPYNYYRTGNYTLKRRRNGAYQALLNVEFKSGSGSLSPQAMLEKSKECLAKASPFIKGPNGDQMELIVMSPAELQKMRDDERPEKNIVKIEQANARSTSGAYAEDANCPTIVHEMLHLLGLCDEYEEKSNELKDKYSCRVVPAASSIMKHHEEAWKKAVVEEISCACTTPTCKTIQKSGNKDLKNIYLRESIYESTDFNFRNKYCKTTSLPSQSKLDEPGKATIVKSNSELELVLEGRTVFSSDWKPYYFIQRNQLICTCPPGDVSCIKEKNSIVKDVEKAPFRNSCPYQLPKADKSTADAIKIKPTPRMDSLLWPNQFNKILAGDCAGVADGYQECAATAYVGQGSKTCNVPPSCQDDKHFLGSAQ